MNNPNQIDYTNLYRAYYISLWVAATLIKIIIVLIVASMIFAIIATMSRTQRESIPMTGIPSIDSGIYPDAHVEEAHQSEEG